MSGSTIFKYGKSNQDASQFAIWSISSGTEDPGYPAINLSGYDLTNPAKLTTLSGEFLADLSLSPSSSTLIGAAIIHSNLVPGLDVRLEGSTSSAFSVINYTASITIPPLNNNWPINGYVIFSAQNYSYWRIKIYGSNTVAISIAHIVLINGLQLIPGAQQGIEWTEEIPTWNDETELSVPMNLDLLTRIKSCKIDTINFDSQQDELDDWFLIARGINLPFLVIPDINKNDCRFMTFIDKMKIVTYRYETPYGTTRTMQIRLKEFGRGMLPTPWLV